MLSVDCSSGLDRPFRPLSPQRRSNRPARVHPGRVVPFWGRCTRRNGLNAAWWLLGMAGSHGDPNARRHLNTYPAGHHPLNTSPPRRRPAAAWDSPASLCYNKQQSLALIVIGPDFPAGRAVARARASPDRSEAGRREAIVFILRKPKIGFVPRQLGSFRKAEFLLR